jgi:hypothetical protein
MRSTRTRGSSLLLALILGAGVLPAFADDGCLDFKWDVSKERALFATPPTALEAGKDAKSAPAVAPNHLYALRLRHQDQVAFSVTPKKMAAAPSFGGLATLTVATPGSYRISVDVPFWIDVVSNGALLQPTDFQGQHACSAPHKIVQFDLAGAQSFVLQFSNASQENVLLTITPTPPRKF